MGFHLQAKTYHAQGIQNAGLSINDEVPWNAVEKLTVVGKGDGPGGVHHAVYIILGNLMVAAGNCHHTMTILRRNMVTSHRHHRSGDSDPRDALRFFPRHGDALRGFVAIHDHSFA
jgi:hypothetical protein